MASRSGFSSRLGFVAAAAGSAVGLGNIWKFPYETADNGGGAFLLIYLLCIFLIGFPVMVGEIALGRKTLSNPYGAYNAVGGKRWALVGLFGVICGVMILSFYNVVAGWAFGYFIEIVFGNLLKSPDHGAYFGDFVSNIGDNFIYSLLFMVLTTFIVMRGVQKGIEAASKVLMPLLFAILIGLIFYALTLPNAAAGISYYLLPDFSKINLAVINSAMGQAFFSLSLGMGTLITYGSYIGKKDNITTSAAIVSLADTSVAFLAGLLMLPLVFSQFSSAEIAEGANISGGPGLVFVTLPGIFEQMGNIGVFIGGAFFLLLSVAALTSTVSLLEVPVAYFTDEKKWNRTGVVIGLSATIFLIGIPSMLSMGAVEWLGNIPYGLESKDFLTIVETTFLDIGLPLGGLLLSLFVVHKWKKSSLSDEIAEGNENYKGSLLETFINLMLTYVVPVLLGLILVSNFVEKFLGISMF